MTLSIPSPLTEVEVNPFGITTFFFLFLNYTSNVIQRFFFEDKENFILSILISTMRKRLPFAFIHDPLDPSALNGG